MEFSEIQLKGSPLYSLLTEVLFMISGNSDFQMLNNAMEQSYEEINRLLEKYRDIPGEIPKPDGITLSPLECLEEIIEIIAELDERIQAGSRGEDLRDLYEDLKEANEVILTFIEAEKAEKEVLFEPEAEMEAILDIVESEVGEERLVTENYLKVENAAARFLDEELEREEVENVIEQMLAVTETARYNYEASYISPSEWTVETALGDRLLVEGLTGWKDSLEQLREGCVSFDEGIITDSIDKLYEANRKLVLVQRISEIVSGENETAGY